MCVVLNSLRPYLHDDSQTFINGQELHESHFQLVGGCYSSQCIANKMYYHDWTMY